MLEGVVDDISADVSDEEVVEMAADELTEVHDDLEEAAERGMITPMKAQPNFQMKSWKLTSPQLQY